MQNVLACSVLVLFGTVLEAQKPQLVKDINTTTGGNPGSYPTRMLTVGAMTFFFALDDGSDSHPEDHDQHLYRTLGIPGTTVMLKRAEPITPFGPFSQGPRWLYPVSTTVYFNGADGHGHELWKTDGTIAGTMMVKNIHPDDEGQPYRNGSGAKPFAHIGNSVFLFANDKKHGRELWKSDGTANGTVLVKDLNPGKGSTDITDGANLSGKIVFGTGAGDLYVSDGTANGTSVIKKGVTASDFTVAGNRAYFRNQLAYQDEEIWRTDGTAAGTVLLQKVKPGLFRNLTPIGNTLYFAINRRLTSELWKTDGTVKGTVLVKKLTSIWEIAAHASKLFINDRGSLWISDGSSSGTKLLKSSVSPFRMTSTPAGLYFVASGLWRSDGTVSGTIQVSKVNALGSTNRGFSFVKGVASHVVFAAYDTKGTELWASNGTAASTKIIADINVAPSHSYPRELTLANGKVFFVARKKHNDWRLWVSDGTPAGTTALFVPPGSDTPEGLTPWGSQVLFCYIDQLWKTDGTTAGTSMIVRVPPRIAYMMPLGHSVLMTAGRDLWTTDGSAAGTRKFKSMNPKGYDLFQQSLRVGDKVFFTFNSAGQRELWQTDGTANGTSLVMTVPRNAFPRYLSAIGSDLYFTLEDANRGREVWKSDGTKAGTIRVTYLTEDVEQIMSAGSHLLIVTAVDNQRRQSLWRSGGTVGSTVLVRRFARQICCGSGMILHAPLGRSMLFLDADKTGASLWITDGTPIGTVKLRDFRSGYGRTPHSFDAVGTRYVYFSADEITSGYELWRTDGTPRGTTRLTDLWAGPPSSYSGSPTLLADGWFYFAPTDQTGIELWRIRAGASSHTYGQSCGASGVRPSLSCTDAVLGKTVTISVRDGLPSKTGMLLIGAPARPTIALRPGCDVFVDVGLPLLSAPFRTNAFGSWTPAPLAVPNIPALDGVLLSLQAAVGPSANPPLGMDLTNGVFATLGR